MAAINYKSLVNPDTFIGRYMAYMEVQETPYAYDFWCACWLISCAVGRNVCVPRPRAPIHLNLYALLLADSGVTRKSTAVRHATTIARAFFKHRTDFIELIEGKMTPEKLNERLALLSEEHGHASAAISISELVTFLGREQYGRAMPGLLTDLYDCPDERSGGGTVGRGRTTISNVFVNFLSASTPSWLGRAVSPDVVEGGFTSRCMFIVSEQRKKRIAWPKDAGDDTEWFVKALCDIHEHARKINNIELTSGAMKSYTRWYERKHESRDPFSASFESREDSHVLRLAAFLAISDGKWNIDAYHVRTAIKVVEEVKRHGSSIFVGGVTNNKLLNGIDLLRTRLVEAGMDGQQHNILFHQVKHLITNAQFMAALDVMHELGMVDCFLVDDGSRGRKRKVWRATKLIAQPGVLADLQGRLEA